MSVNNTTTGFGPISSRLPRRSLRTEGVLSRQLMTKRNDDARLRESGHLPKARQQLRRDLAGFSALHQLVAVEIGRKVGPLAKHRDDQSRRSDDVALARQRAALV